MNMTKKLNKKCPSCEKEFETVKVSSKKTKQDDNEKEILFKMIEKVEEDIDHLVISKNVLLAELNFYNPEAEKLKRLICDIELWASELHNSRVPELDDAREIFLKRRATHKVSNAVDEL